MSRPSAPGLATSGPPARAPLPGPRGALAASAVSGLLLFLLGLVATPPDGPAVGTATADQIREFVRENDLALRLAVTAGLLVVAALVVFVGALAARIRAAAPGSPLVAAVSGAGLLVAVVQLLDVAAVGTPRLLPGLIGTSLTEVDDATLRGWYSLAGFTHFLGDLQMAPIAVVLVAFSIAALRLRLLPRWLGWAGAVLGAAAALGAVGITLDCSQLYPLWFVGLFGWWLWGLAIGVTSALRWRRARPAG
jgi:hypothetical protein